MHLNSIEEALNFISSDDRDTWLRMGMAIKSALGEKGFDVWNKWSQKSDSYNFQDAKSVWKSITADEGIQIGTLFHEAQLHGWRATSTTIIDSRKHTSIQAKKIWAKSTLVKTAHPYLTKKGVSSVCSIREIDLKEATKILRYSPKSKGKHLKGRLLVIPIKIDTELSSLELIDETGLKSALLGKGSKSGGYWSASSLPDLDSEFTLLIGEGVATILSAQEATGFYAVAALSSGNLLSISKKMREKFSNALIIVLADLIKSTGSVDSNALKSAIAINGQLAIPYFGDCRDNQDKDFNDMHRVCGLESVKQTILNASEPVKNDLSSEPSIEITCASDMRLAPILWLWKEWLAAGKLHILGGAPGTGKTTIALALSAIITRGGRWPDSSTATPGNVMIWSGEDDPKDTLVPRLQQAGANLARVFFITGIRNNNSHRSFDPAMDMELLRVKLDEIENVHFLIIDPIVSAITGDSHKNAEVRRGLQPLVDLAAHKGFALLGITHFSKGTKGREPVERLTGSLAFGALARIVLIAAKYESKKENDSSQRVLLRAKSNIGPDDGGFIYELKQAQLETHPDIHTSFVVWREVLLGSAREILNTVETLGEDSKSTLSEAKDFLANVLAGGPIHSELIKEEAEDLGFSTATIRRAKKELCIQSMKNGTKEWLWLLPKDGPSSIDF